jgi:hypothetical protein
MAQYTKLGDLHNSQNLGSFESYGLSNLGADWFGAGCDSSKANTCDQNNCYDAQGCVSQDPCEGQQLHSMDTNALISCEEQAKLPSGAQRYREELGRRGFTRQANGTWQQSQAAEDSGTNAGEVLTGIAAILAPLAQAGVGIYGASQQAKLAEQRLKHGGGRGGGGGDAALLAAISRSQQGGSNSGVIIVVVLLVVGMMGMMMFMMGKKK